MIEDPGVCAARAHLGEIVLQLVERLLHLLLGRLFHVGYHE
jgi:hypothetical protein